MATIARLLPVVAVAATAALSLAAAAGGCVGSIAGANAVDDVRRPDIEPPSAPRADGLHAVARDLNHYLVNYGRWTAAAIDVARRHQMVILHPGRADTAATIAAIRPGVDPRDPADDVMVICYVSVGEDPRTRALTDDQIRADPRLRGDGSGPRMDPRGPEADGASLAGVAPLGLPSNGGVGFASYYLDDNDVHTSEYHVGDGFPDRNAVYGGLFVNAGDPAWFQTLDQMTLEGPDRHAGLKEILTTTHGRGLDCDGVFLDTLDTASPNAYTDASSRNPTNFEWTAPGLASFIRRLHAAYPDKLIVQNRGLFFFDPRLPQYAFSPRGAIDFLMFESFRLSSNAAAPLNPVHFADNRYNVAPMLMAEANRPDGFKVLSLGYATGPVEVMSPETLTGGSTLGRESLLEDIQVAEAAGFRHYLTDPAVNLVNEFVRVHAVRDDRAPPRWTSTYNDRPGSPASEPTARVGLQQASGRGGEITVRWDVALDLHRVRYVLYAQPTPFDFDADPGLARARRFPLEPIVPPDYRAGTPGSTRLPYQATLSGFPAGQTQHLLLRAVDSSSAENEDDNRVVRTATP